MSETEHEKWPSGASHPRLDADQGREPEFVAGRLGTRQVSKAALVERVVTAFLSEHDLHAVLREAPTRAARLALLRPTVDYVLAVESVLLSSEALAQLLREAYNHIFGYGPLHALLTDERVTTIALEGADRVAVRYGHSELTSMTPIFDDAEQQREIVARLLAAAGAELRDDVPVIETGLYVENRPVALSVVMPSVGVGLNADIRLHPPAAPALADLVSASVLSDDAAHFLSALVASPYGFIIVGDSETGKTTLLSALAECLPDVQMASVERSGELRLRDSAKRRTVHWPVGEQPGMTFGEQVSAAVAAHPDVLLLDEVRADDPLAIAPLVGNGPVPRLLWTCRGAPDAKRLQAALGMLARRTGLGESAVHTLYERLPFVISMVRVQGRLRLFSIGEWQPTVLSDYPDYVLLYQYQDGAARRTDRQPRRPVAVG